VKKPSRRRKARRRRKNFFSYIFHARKNDDRNVGRKESRIENQCVDPREENQAKII